MAEMKKGKLLFSKEETHWGYVTGEAKWAKVLEPGQYEAFEIDVYPDEEEMSKYLEAVSGVARVAFDGAEENGKKAVIQDEFVKTNDEGVEYLKFKLEETGYEGKANKIDIYDEHGNKQPDWSELIGNGSKVKVKYRAKPYFMSSSKVAGASTRFYALQVLELVAYTGGTDEGFSDTTGGKEPAEDGEF